MHPHRRYRRGGRRFHCTFFEMLGNWSLGDYFKKEAIEFSWEFLTSLDWLGLDKESLYFTCFEGEPGIPKDTEAHDHWVRMGVDPSHIFYLPRKYNWWGPAGQTGPCGRIPKCLSTRASRPAARTAPPPAPAASSWRSGTTFSCSTTRPRKANTFPRQAKRGYRHGP